MNELCKQALIWHRLGYSVIPIEKRGKRPLVKWSNYVDNRATISQIVQWFKNDINIAVLCGGANKLVVVDFDTQQGYYSAMSRLDNNMTELISNTYKVKTGRGIHLFFNGVESKTRKNVEEKIDVKGIGGYVLVPPSVHPSGREYRRLNGKTQQDIVSLSIEQLYTIANIGEEEEVVKFDNAVYDAAKDDDDSGFLSSHSDFEYVRSRVSILRIAMMLTPMFQKSGKYWMGKCPVHKDTSPSFWVDTELGIAKCYSTACQLNDKAVDVIGLWALANNISYVESMRQLLDMI